MSGLIRIKCQRDLPITIDITSHPEDIDLDGTDPADTKIAHHPETELLQKYPELDHYLEVTPTPVGLVCKTWSMVDDRWRMTR